MARLIDAEPILMKWNTESLGRKEMYDMVKNAPTIDAEPVIRCNDCKCWTEWANGTGSCNRFALNWIGTDADDFCSMGERKDDELQEDNGRSQVPCSE